MRVKWDDSCKAHWLVPGPCSVTICVMNGHMVNGAGPFPLFWECYGVLWYSCPDRRLPWPILSMWLRRIQEYVGLSNNSLTSLSGCSNSAITDWFFKISDQSILAHSPLQKTQPCPIGQGIGAKCYWTSKGKNSTLNWEDRWRGKETVTQIMRRKSRAGEFMGSMWPLGDWRVP